MMSQGILSMVYLCCGCFMLCFHISIISFCGLLVEISSTEAVLARDDAAFCIALEYLLRSSFDSRKCLGRKTKTNRRNSWHKRSESNSPELHGSCVAHTAFWRFHEMGVPPQSSIFIGVFYYCKPSILGYPHDYGNPHVHLFSRLMFSWRHFCQA